tara:strand:+ start:31 stop:504 length:474 start_codon:yes stop_codon:yes gene_type:complete
VKRTNKKVKKINLKSEGKTIWKMGECFYQEIYSGEVLDGVPHGQGISEEYEKYPKSAVGDYLNLKSYNQFWKKYSKNFMHKEMRFYLSAKYTGEWKMGKKDGKGELISYVTPDEHPEYPYKFIINKDGTPEIASIQKGTFKDGFPKKVITKNKGLDF